MDEDWRMTEESTVVIPPSFIDKWMPVFEEGEEENEERAFLLIGAKEEGIIKIKQSIKVPESNCREDEFDPLPLKEMDVENSLGYVHLHPFRPNEMKPFLNFQIQLSPSDYRDMMARKESIRGIAHLLPAQIRNENQPVHGIIVFYGSHYPRTLDVEVAGIANSSIGCYLRKNGGWKVLSVQQ